MHYRRLGRSGLKVSEISLGAWITFGAQLGEEAAAELIHAAYEQGINFFDNADMYAGGQAEDMMGRAIRDLPREALVISSKVFWPTMPGPNGRGLSRKHVTESVNASLRRLDVEYLDLYYCHRYDPDTPVEDTIGAMARLVEEGKVRYLGISEASANSIKKASAVHPVAALQSEFSLWTRDIEMEILPLCVSLGIGVVPFSPLGRGFLSGKIKDTGMFAEGDFRKDNPRFSEENFKKNLLLVERIEEMAAAKQCTPAQLALAWVLAQWNGIVPIPGTKKVKYLEENIAAVDIELTAGELEEINRALPAGAAAGARYNEEMMKAVNK